jgi:uncharacterized protein involved in exopolysaccharide biosynthesis
MNFNGASADSGEISLGDVYQTLKNGRRLIGRFAISGLLVGTAVAFVIPNTFISTAELMPPDQQSIASPSPMMQASGIGLTLGAGAGSLISQRTPGQTVVGMLDSDTVLDAVIDKNDLRRVYRKRYIEDARKSLLAHTDIAEDKKSGLVMINVTARTPTQAHAIAATFLDRLMVITDELSTSSAKRERIFLQQRLKDLTAQLEQSTAALGKFSSQNATMDIRNQATATLEAASRVQGQLIAAESDLSSLRTRFADSSPQVKSAEASISALQSKLNALSGAGQTAVSDAPSGDQIAPSIRALPLLQGRYQELARDVASQEVLFQTLTKQYELARVEESKVIPAVRVLQEPSTPEERSGPHRLIIIALITFALCLGSSLFLLWRQFWFLPGDTA